LGLKIFASSGGRSLNSTRKGGPIFQELCVVSADLLQDAQKHPESYPGLLVRVAGYSAFFADPDAAVQNNIVSRTEHSL